MAISALELTRSLLAYQINTDRASVEKLLKRNGVSVPMGATDAEVISASLLASGKSANFKKELASLLASNAKKAGQEYSSFVGQDMGFTGIDDFSFTGLDDFSFTGTEDFFNGNGKEVRDARKAAKTATKLEAAKKGDKSSAGKALAWIGQNIFTKENIDTAVQVGLTKINTKTQNKANQVAQEGLTIQQYQDELTKSKANDSKGGKLSTMAWVGIGVGAAALIGIVIYFATKKK